MEVAWHSLRQNKMPKLLAHIRWCVYCMRLGAVTRPCNLFCSGQSLNMARFVYCAIEFFLAAQNLGLKSFLIWLVNPHPPCGGTILLCMACQSRFLSSPMRLLIMLLCFYDRVWFSCAHAPFCLCPLLLCPCPLQEHFVNIVCLA